MLGMHGSYAANMTVTESDLVISIGGRFDDRATGGNFEEFAPNADIIHIDIDPSSIDKNIPVECPIVGDAKIVLRQILDALPGEIDLEGRESWLRRIRDWNEKHPLTYCQEARKF